MIGRPSLHRAASRRLSFFSRSCLDCFLGSFRPYILAVAATVLMNIVPASGTALAAPPGFDLADLEDTAPLLNWMDTLPDPESGRTWQTALTAEEWQPLTMPRPGYLQHPIWTRLELVNSGPLPRTVILYNQRPLLAHLTVFVLVGNELLEHRDLGFFEPRDPRRDIIHRLANMPVTLAPGETRTILARLETAGLMEADWIAATEAAFARKTLREFMILGLYCGVMLALMGQMLFFWLTYRKPWFLILAAYALCFLLYMLIVHGSPRIADLGIPAQVWVAAAGTFVFLAVVCLISFSISFLDMARTMPWVHRWLRGLQGVLVVAVATNVLAAWWPELIRFSPFWGAVGRAAGATFLVAGILAVIRKLDHAWLYLLGHVVFFLASATLASMFHKNYIHDLSSIILLHPLVVILHMTVLVLSLGMLARHDVQRLARLDLLLLEQSRFAAIGRTIGMLAHQWRAPLARLGAQLTELRTYFRFAPDIRDHAPVIRDDLLPAMQNGLRHMTDTVRDFQDFFSADHPGEDYDPSRVLDQVLDMLNGQIVSTCATVDRHDHPGPLSLTGHPSALAHVLMVLTGNALEMFSLRDIQKPRMAITLEHDATADQIVLRVEDNAGGITARPLERIFVDFYSEKGRYHTGMGLGIAKKLVEERMGGSIDVKNIEQGARFTVRIPRKGGPPHKAPTFLSSGL
ncbi:sensor histidine kinase [Desulfonatronum sp. SC1]|uniref:sensor histidine kinase n=1 Tax=Desulfonatronum sp. SC1 TaxID=2109626 RepID=UPI000D3260BE|nr:sensor histidine kinase [Desulfonatronum sp. SC1]PTN33033.1 hypothetical protein C6366_15440 [Desulfonatronum sp. SC1]